MEGLDPTLTHAVASAPAKLAYLSATAVGANEMWLYR
jgi:hypothetical protein